jgi:UDP-N-acetylmuramate: L-alanyl-gamma-D-glutamyl-meso-diaminopimelate ligase
VARAFCPVERYGRNTDSTWRIDHLKFGTESTSWSLLRNGKPWADFEFPLAGEYNVWNASAAAAMAANYGIPAAVIKEALKRFASVKRRLEVKAEVNGITIIDDFAHHPTAIAGTLNALRGRYAGRRLWAILEPRSNTLRRNVFHDELARSLAIADEIVIANVFKSESIPEAQRLDVGTLAAQLGREGHHARVLADVDSIVKICSPEMRRGDVIAILSNGGFGGIYEKLPERLRSLSIAAESGVATRSQG